MSLLPFSDLPPFKPRRFVPAKLNLGDWSQISPLYDKLEASLRKINSARALEKWLLDWSELASAIEEEGARRHIAMTCHTDNPEAEKAFLEFIEKIEPQMKPRNFRLDQGYLAHPARKKLSKARYALYDKHTKVHVELFREENVALETEDDRLGQQYQKITGAQTVNFRGDEKTLIQMGRYLEEPDRPLREEAWTVVAKRRLQDKEKFEDIFDQMLTLRQKIAKNAGFSNYRDYKFKHRGRFDYTPNDCLKFHDAVEKHVMPLLHCLNNERKKDLGLKKLRPWDLAVDPENQPPLRPFEKIETMVERTQTIFDKLDAGLAAGFRQMDDLKLLDLANRKGKAPGGYQTTLSEARLPFIFMNAIGVQRDVETILHEAGHAFHTLAAREEDFKAYRHAPTEFCEVASMSMELLGNEYLETFYKPDEAKRARREHLEGIIEVFPWIATVDAFQHWIYTHPNHTRAQRKAAWNGLMKRFGAKVDWTGYEDARGYLWHRQLHIFLYPFYYIEYGIAQLGALQVWANSKRNHAKALRQYQNALALGGSKPLPKLFTAAGCRFDFSAKTVKPLAQLVQSELTKLH